MKFIIALAFMLLAILPPGPTPHTSGETLIVFTQEADEHFLETCLPRIRDYAQSKGIRLEEKSVAQGVPANITVTPALVFQNDQGRSLYSSRYAEFSTIENFIRNSRLMSQTNGEFERSQVLVWEQGRAKIVAPLKITAMSGKVPRNYSADDFERQVKMQLGQGLQKFQWKEHIALQRSDRQFYLDLHPFATKEGKLYLSMQIFSQFSCKESVYDNFDQALEGRLEDPTEVLQQAASTFEREVQRIIQGSELGDAFTAIPSGVPVQTWDELGLSLPEREGSLNDFLQEVPPIPVNWQQPEALGQEIPMVQFRFRAPLDRYLGEIKQIQGTVDWDEATGMLRGNFMADMSSLTMGMASFDEVVLKDYVKVKKHPISSFQFETPLSTQSLDFGQTLNQKVAGTFELMGKKRPVEVIAKISPIIDSHGQARLLVNTTFELNVVKDFKIKGPDGPSPAREIMEFHLSFLMQGA